MARPSIVNLEPIVVGNTWDGMSVSYTSSGSAFANTLTAVSMEFKTPGGVLTQTLSSAAGTITITTATPNAWLITVPKIILTLTDGNWHWAITTTDSAGIVKTRNVGTLLILPKGYIPTT